MLIIALVLALVGLAALVFAVVTTSELVAWVCIGASVLGVVLLIIDALREREFRRRRARNEKRHEEGAAEGKPEELPNREEQGFEVADTDINESFRGAAGGEGRGEGRVVPADGHRDDAGR
ncbi:MAG: hypothetical protein PHQ28_07950 [Mycobacterium sp.]|nr:hypothetical protein [Mycobacterium sp.]